MESECTGDILAKGCAGAAPGRRSNCTIDSSVRANRRITGAGGRVRTNLPPGTRVHYRASLAGHPLGVAPALTTAGSPIFVLMVG
jgi:hypothetical protein